MSEIALSPEQKQTLHKYASELKKWLDSPKGKANVKEHRDHEAYFKEKLSEKNIEKITEDEFRKVFKTLWASNIWGNKDWYLDNRLINQNGFDKIKRELNLLLYGPEDIAERYDRFKSNIKGFGPSSITEILHFVFPDKFCLWNDKPKTVMPFLGLDILPNKFFKYGFSSGSEYLQCVKALRVLKDELEEYGINDFIDLDILLWYIFENMKPVEKALEVKEPEKPSQAKIDSHEAAEYYLLEIGKMLGYLTYTVDVSKSYQNNRLGDVAILKEIPPFTGERDLSTAKLIDVIWFNEEENPTHCFEVEHSTDIVKGLDRLIQLQHLYAKFFIVASEDKRSKFESLLTRIQYRKIRDRFNFISYEDLVNLYESALPFHNLRVKILGE